METRFFSTLLLVIGFIGAPVFSTYAEIDEPNKTVSSAISTNSMGADTDETDLFVRLEQVGSRLDIVISDCDSESKGLATEVKRLSSEMDEIQKIQDRALFVIEKMRDVIKARCEYIVVNGQAYSKEEVAEALKVTIDYYRKAVDKESEYQGNLIDAKRKYRESLVRLDKWKAEEDRLDGVVSTLRANHQERRNNSESLDRQEVVDNAKSLIEALDQRMTERESAKNKSAELIEPSLPKPSALQSEAEQIAKPKSDLTKVINNNPQAEKDSKVSIEALKTVEAFDKEFQLKETAVKEDVSSPN
jgi:hypothetical protein